MAVYIPTALGVQMEGSRMTRFEDTMGGALVFRVFVQVDFCFGSFLGHHTCSFFFQGVSEELCMNSLFPTRLV